RRRAAAKEDGADGALVAGQGSACELHFAQRRLDIALASSTLGLAGSVGVEVAIPATHLTKWDVDVDPQRPPCRAAREVSRERYRASIGRHYFCFPPVDAVSSVVLSAAMNAS